MQQDNTKNNLKFKHKLGYGLGDAGGCLTFTLMGNMFAMYCTDALGINEYLLATLLFIWNVWDFINDPIMGAIMDKVFAKNNNPRGKFRPWILRSAPLICVTFIALWSVPQFFDGIAMLAILFCLKILYEASYTMFNIPMGSLLSSMSTNDAERASLSAARGIGSGIGYALPGILMPLLIDKLGGSTNPTGYAVGSAICAGIGFVLCLLHYRYTEERTYTDVNPEQAENVKFTDILKVFKVNRPFVALCLHGLFICLMQSSNNTLNNYMFTTVFGDLSLASYSMIVSAPFMVLILIFGSKAAKKFGLERMIRVSLLIGSVLYISLFAVHMLTNINPWVYIIWSGIAMGVSNVSIYLQWGLVGEAVDYNEMITGKRTEGSIYGTFNLARRVGQTIATSGALVLLGLFGYDETAGTAQTATAIFGIKASCILLPGIFILGSWIAFKFVWNMNKEKREAIVKFNASKEIEAKEETIE
ncbi:MAG: MFS transporter [Acholeplasmatales bacterium]|nr:MFS transporter [Acholeplasmatales bacterium]